ncbi:methyltransferase domain-containing protein [Arthrobacter sp. NEB 688]|uniref:class I SAM-dependent methyltransferase n=1 Tax=Arthrobacter sp. NEB 688 TaxID=904039 RepID=UPI001566CF00|nr:methyltransferase domain-containing protein [Arthrobacter sp. NEB 688]QKE83168.1 methyltransferase domain-containing protein [Arthrobacter sp. NEB 688]
MTPSSGPTTTPRPLGELRLFLREALRDPAATGAVAPSGAALVDALSRPALAARRPVRVLEVGAGSGRVTGALCRGLPAGSHLDVVEANPRFAAHLGRLVAAAGGDVEVRVVCGRVQDLRHDASYDHVVSALPFTNFEPADVEHILGLYSAWLRPSGRLAYFAYRGTGMLRRVTSSPQEVRRHREVARVLAAHHRGRQTSSTTVWRNLPPARVHHVEEPVARPGAGCVPGAASRSAS